MADVSNRDILFSFFMFTANLNPGDADYAQTIVKHMHKLKRMGYAGFDLPIAPTETTDRQSEVESYEGLRRTLVEAGLGDLRFTTNVAATSPCDPSSPDEQTRQSALLYLRSRVDITKALGGDIMAGPIVVPYGVFPTAQPGEGIWSNALQLWLAQRYQNALPVICELGKYAQEKGVRLAIEPVDHWETPGPNLVREVMDFVEKVQSPYVGLCVDSAHVVLGSDGPEVFESEMESVSDDQPLHYVHISAPDRGAVHKSWIPWKAFLKHFKNYQGPFLVEVFNAIPVFQSPLRLTRRKFWIDGEDDPDLGTLSAYEVARRAIAAVRHEFSEVGFI